ncbi:uncharacterized protein K441DRAFT_558493, partial [Cenococcum geophilum 1.58]|uniref:uncharacterized protein n=1 Tax=Cenococcum geophilum 1.58 TaxID=794803 RepID=UPI00358EAD71
TFKLSIIKLAFRQAGLVPYNPQIVFNSICEARLTTPPPLPPYKPPSTLYILRSLHTVWWKVFPLA